MNYFKDHIQKLIARLSHYQRIIPELYRTLVYCGLAGAALLSLWFINTTLAIVLTTVACSFLFIELIVWYTGKPEPYTTARHRSTLTRRLIRVKSDSLQEKLKEMKQSWSQKISSLRSGLEKFTESEDVVSSEQQLVRQTLDSLTPSKTSCSGSIQMQQAGRQQGKSIGHCPCSEETYTFDRVQETRKNTLIDN